MSANITNDSEMFYVETEGTPWHGLGTPLSAVATAREAIEAAGLDWEVNMVRARLQYREDGRTQYKPIDNVMLAVRMDNHTVLGHMGPQYTPVQNVDAFRGLDEIVGAGEAIYHTAGSLGQGERIWILAKLPEDLDLPDGSKLRQFILLSNSHDGNSALRIQMTDVRVVCENTLNWALNGTGFKARHTSGVMSKFANAREFLGLTEAYGQMLLRSAERMYEKAFTTDDALRSALDLFVPTRDIEVDIYAQAEALKEPTASSVAKVVDLFHNGRGNKGQSAWDYAQAVAEFVDFDNPVGRKLDTLGSTDTAVMSKRLDSQWFGRGKALKQTAFDQAMAGIEVS